MEAIFVLPAALTIPAVLALAVKVAVLLKSQASKFPAWRNYVLFLGLLNFAELTLMLQAVFGMVTEFALRLYFVSCVLALCYGVWYCGHLLSSQSRRFALGFNLVVMVFLVLIIFTDTIIQGVIPDSVLPAAYKGPLFKLFLSVCLVGFIAQIVMLFHGRATASCFEERQYYSYNLLAIGVALSAPILLLTLWLVGIEISTLVILPIAITFLLLVSRKGITENISSSEFMFIDRKELKAKQENIVLTVLEQYEKGALTHEQAMFLIERELVSFKFAIHSKVVSPTADSMGVTDSSLQSMLRRMMIETKTDQNKNR